ncbi:hypothetical protein Vafri_19302 [Volvox africanus]|uniref:Methyltransferase type 11 domain-containing protein n=1 Tax=Volvox africanus TaxID=51714 RepID=A0A8J4BQ04_9CHLO|nr:hypothetical protein Vafri_19302 [Volvox africanus]
MMTTLSDAAPPSIQARLANLRYAEKEYWNSRYTSQPCEFDWFYGYNALRKIVRTFVKRNKPVLQVGCGNSNFQEGMARDGYQVVNVSCPEESRSGNTDTNPKPPGAFRCENCFLRPKTPRSLSHCNLTLPLTLAYPSSGPSSLSRLKP